MGTKIDLTGQRFGRLVVVGDSGERNSSGVIKWFCLCDCGNYKAILSRPMRMGVIKSCGCLHKETASVLGKNNGAKNNKKAQEWQQKNDNKEGTKLTSLTAKVPSNNSSGVKGVSWNKERNKWESYIQLKGNRMRLGQYTNLQDAIQARKEGEEKYFKPILEKYGKE